ncbi:MAG: hypothetical protein QXX79_04680 [Candidatus Bathyarchaeia archaeon]
MKKRLITALLIIILALIVLYQIRPPPSLLLLSISRLELQGGTEQDKKWVKGYWVLHFALDQYEEYMGYLEADIPKNTTATTPDGKKVYTNASIQIKLRPEKSYITRPIKLQPELVTPTTYMSWWNKLAPSPCYGTDIKADSVTAKLYVWAGDPEIHTEWTAEVWVEGQLAGTAKIDTKAGATTVTVNTNKGDVIVKNLGYLQGRFIPTWQDIIAFSRKYVYRYSDSTLGLIRYDSGALMVDHGSTGKLWIVQEGSSNAYSTYWYGPTRWKDVSDLYVRGTPAGWTPDTLLTYYVPIDTAKYGGWDNKDDFWNNIRYPVAPVIFPEDKDDRHRPFMSLIEYLEYKGCENVAEKLFPNAEKWTLDTEKMEARIDLPWAAYYIPEGVIYVPTELADTWVYYPPVSNVKITAVGWETGETVRQISGTARCWIDIVQQADIESSAKITAQASTPKATVNPAETTVTLKPGESRRLYFDVQNLGVDTDTEGYITFTAYETWTNTATSRNSDLHFKLLAYSTETTILDVLVIDKQSQTAVAGIIVYCYYEGQTKSGISSTSGLSFDLATYRGTVTLTTLATDVYKSATVTRMASGRTSITVELEKQGAPPPTPTPEWLLYAILGIAIAAIVVAVYAIRRKR